MHKLVKCNINKEKEQSINKMKPFHDYLDVELNHRHSRSLQEEELSENFEAQFCPRFP